MSLWRLQHLLLCACAPLRAARVASVVVVPVVRWPLALVLIVLAPLLGILLILVIAGLRVGLGSGGWWWGIGGRIVGAIAPIVVGRWRWRWRWWGCVALGVSLVVGRLAVTRLWRAVAAHCRGAGIGAGARDVAVFVVAAGSRRVPSRAIARWWRWLLRWWLWWWWLLWWWLLLRSPVIAASVVGVVVIPVVVTPAVLVVATTSAAVETSSVVASSSATTATTTSAVLETSSVASRRASVVITLETAATPTASEATTSVVKALFRGWAGLPAFLVILPHQLVCFLSLELNEQNLIQEVPNIRQSKVSFHF